MERKCRFCGKPYLAGYKLFYCSAKCWYNWQRFDRYRRRYY